MNILDIEAPVFTALNGPVRLHAEYALLTDIVLATPETAFQDKPDGVNLRPFIRSRSKRKLFRCWSNTFPTPTAATPSR